MVDRRHRGLVVLRGLRTETAARAQRVVAALSDVVWVGAADGTGRSPCTPADVRRGLGSSCDAVVLDLHDGLEGDTLGRVHGLIRGGGALVLRMNDQPLSGRMGFWFERQLAQTGAVWVEQPMAALPSVPPGSAEQDDLVDALGAAWAAPVPTVSVVLADRGRGKSAGVGRAVAQLAADCTVAVCGPHPAAVAEVLAFAARPELKHVAALDLVERLSKGLVIDVLVIDEAAQVPVPLLQMLCRSAPEARIVLATTTHGYEGTGHGFEHRVVPWLQAEPRATKVYALAEPIRWAAGDPLEGFVSAVLLLDAGPARGIRTSAMPQVTVIDRDGLVRSPARLRAVYGLLARAHYRTSPSDLHHLLDDPGVQIHVVQMDEAVVAVGWLVADGALDEETIAAVERGVRLRGAALAESLICHSGRADAGGLTMWRSVRTVVHPELRGRGLARRLVDHEHAVHGDADLIGTMFGATADLIRMRQAMGYVLVRLGLSRSARSGVPSVVMLRPVSARARALVAGLRRDLARDLPGQLERLSDGAGVPLEPALLALLQVDLPEASTWTTAGVAAAMQRYVDGAAPIDVLGDAPRLWLDALTARGVDWKAPLSVLEQRAVALRVVEGAAWGVVATNCGTGGVRIVQRAVRRGLRNVWMRHGRPPRTGER